MGCVLSAAQGQAPARQAALHAGLKIALPAPQSIKSAARE